jgi:DNA-binding response OmpR family regulator
MSRRVLVVDDDVRVHELIRWALRAPVYEVHAFSDPQRALVRVADVKPDLIICDMMMPSMDGQVFLRLVKRAPGLSRVPFLFLTAVRLGSEVQAALSAGADAYLVKPFPLAKLVETVETVLKRDRGAAEPRVSDADASEVPWPETTSAELLEALSAPEGVPRAAASPGTRNASMDALAVPPAEMATRGRTALSSTPLAPPERPDDDAEVSAPAETSTGGPGPVFEGRFSTLELEIGRVRVVTQAASRPNFVITTVLALEDEQKGLKKIETFWCHPLHREEDLELVQRQINLQHERAIEEARHEPLFGPRRDVVWRRDSSEPERP